MIVLRPDRVDFGDETWDGVVRVAIDRESAKTIEGYDETGSFATHVDVARQRVVIRVTQEIVGNDLEAPIPGQLGELELMASNGTEHERRRVRCDCVIESVQNRISDYGATRSIVMIAQSESGESDPVRISNP